MKALVKPTLFLFLLMTGNGVLAQSGKIKFGHINSQELLSLMPERDTAQLQLERYVEQLQDQMEVMQVEYQNKVQKYLAEQEKYSDLIRQSKEQELTDLRTRIENFQTSAQEDMQRREFQLLQPVIQKAEKAVKDVGKENGFTYIFDLSRGSVIYFSDDSQDVLPLVKKKLGIE